MEGFGLVCLEAALCGTKVFAAASGGITDAIHPNKNGWLLTSGNHIEWINKINNIGIYNYEEELPATKRIAYTIDNFSWDKMVSGYLKQFKQL